MKCKRCNGIGIEPDHKVTGNFMRIKRLEKKISLVDMAFRIGYSPAYLSDLELGKRAWNSDLIEKFNRNSK